MFLTFPKILTFFALKDIAHGFVIEVRRSDTKLLLTAESDAVFSSFGPLGGVAELVVHLQEEAHVSAI